MAAAVGATSAPLLGRAWWLEKHGRLYLPPSFGSIQGAAELLTYASTQILVPGQTMAQEYAASFITKNPETKGDVPALPELQHHIGSKFADWKLLISGLVHRPTSFSLTDLRTFPMTTQISMLSCYGGWSQIQPFSGVQLSRVLAYVGLRANARWVVVEAFDGWWDSIDLLEALHPQTLLNYGGLNGEPLSAYYGAPLRLRVPRHMGYKNLKWLKSISVIDDLESYRDGMGSWAASIGDSWYAGPS